MLNSFEELCIRQMAAVNSFIYIYIYIYIYNYLILNGGIDILC